jgi:hypothetical protein
LNCFLVKIYNIRRLFMTGTEQLKAARAFEKQAFGLARKAWQLGSRAMPLARKAFTQLPGKLQGGKVMSRAGNSFGRAWESFGKRKAWKSMSKQVSKYGDEIQDLKDQAFRAVDIKDVGRRKVVLDGIHKQMAQVTEPLKALNAEGVSRFGVGWQAKPYQSYLKEMYRNPIGTVAAGAVRSYVPMQAAGAMVGAAQPVVSGFGAQKNYLADNVNFADRMQAVYDPQGFADSQRKKMNQATNKGNVLTNLIPLYGGYNMSRNMTNRAVNGYSLNQLAGQNTMNRLGYLFSPNSVRSAQV